MSDLIKTELPLTSEERQILKVIVNEIIPADDQFRVPGAADPDIFTRILTLANQFEEPLKNGLIALNRQSVDRFQTSFIESTAIEQSNLMRELRDSGNTFVRIVLSITLQSYYQDPRVLESVDLETRAPHPQGYNVEQGDWSLLDPVRKRQKFYRQV